jgi:hypothetical protein
MDLVKARMARRSYRVGHELMPREAGPVHHEGTLAVDVAVAEETPLVARREHVAGPQIEDLSRPWPPMIGT